MQNIHNSIQIVTLSKIATSTTNKEFQRTLFNLNRPLVIHFIAKQRIKEIGIRKTNGARIIDIIQVLNWNFLKWIAIAIIISVPTSYLIMAIYLRNFAYKTTLSWWIFALAGLMAMGIALLTVSYQSWKAATRNPIESLRYE